jgi:hypothetical protein
MGPKDRNAPPPPDEEGDGRTQMLNVNAPKPAPRRAAPTVQADENPGATQMLNPGAPAAPPPRRAAPRVDEAPAAAPRSNAARAVAPPADDGRTQMLDVRNIPTAQELRQQALKKAAQSNAPARRKKMPEEIEVPVEHLHEAIHEKAHEESHGHAHGGAGFNMMVALSSAILAVLAAVSALMAGHYANEAMLEQIHASDNWSFFQAKSIKATVLQSKVELLTGLGKSSGAGDDAKIEQYAKEQKDISKKAKELEAESQHHMNQHQVLARTVTLLQISIALSAIAVLTRKKPLWYLSLLGGAAGLVILVQALFFTH